MGATDLPHLLVLDADGWDAWLDEHGDSSPGVMLQIGKKGHTRTTLSWPQAVEVGLCHGWIDSQSARLDEAAYLQRFTRRGPRSIWSLVNVRTVERREEQGRLRPAGLAAVQAARADGRWDRAYAGSATAEVPADLQEALEQVPAALAAFSALDRTNRYAVIFRVGRVLPVNRPRTIDRLIDRLAGGWVPHP